MTKINRDIKGLSSEKYDAIIIGGGIYGIMLLLEATRKHLRPLMIDERDFNSQTSLNFLRTLHGGLRYLQNLDLKRFWESVGERKWFMQYFSQFVQPMACLMPLYRKGLKRRSILRIAVYINDLLSKDRNKGIQIEKQLPKSKTINPDRVKQIFPRVNPIGLEGGAIWYDASIEEHQRFFMEILKQAVHNGGSALNYLKATGLLSADKKVKGISTKDMVTGQEFEFRAPVVINSAGPWNRDLSVIMDKDYPQLFPRRLLNWNILFDREALSRYSLGLTPDTKNGHTYFFHNWKNQLLVGTGELVVEKNETDRLIPAKAMDTFLGDINSMVQGLDLEEKNILRVYAGILPAKRDGTLAKRAIILDHGKNNGPCGLFSISGVKFTTARLVAEQTINRIFPGKKTIPYSQILDHRETEQVFFEYGWNSLDKKRLEFLEKIKKNESVVHLSDLLLRRTSIGDNPPRAFRILDKLKKLFPGDADQWLEEVILLKAEMKNLNILNTRLP